MTPQQYDRQHLRHLDRMQKTIDKLFTQAVKDLSSYSHLLTAPPDKKPFSFKDYPHVQKSIDRIFEEFRRKVSLEITQALDWEDNLSATKASDLATKYGVAIPSLRSKAVEAFAQRKVGGLNLSQRVWNITNTFYKEVETAFDIALRDGTPANRLATDLKQYLKYPDKLFRRVRDEHGQLQLSKKAREFHPGQGVYRSSYRNARRLAVTETNMAYHKADNERWRQLDFVLGYEVKVSGTNPNVCPLCMELEGKYPKEFEFVGWHPHCRCHAIPILEKPEDFLKRQQALLQGQHVPPLGAVKQPPQNFLQHLKDNQERLQQASKRGTLPYFIRDNYKVTKKGELTPIFARQKNQQKPSIQEVAKARQKARTLEEIKGIKRRWIQRNARIRHANRTPEEIQSIKDLWNERRVNRNYGKRILATMDGISDVGTSRLRDLLKRGDHKAILQEARRLRDIGKEITSLKHLDNPLQVARNFSMADAKLVDKAVADKLKTFRGLSNEQKLKKLKYEVEWVEEHKKYSTWAVARDAYKKEYAKVEQTVYWDGKKSVLSALKSFKTSSKLYKDDLSKLADAIAKGNKTEAETAIARLEKKRLDLYTKRNKNIKVDFPPEAYSQERKDKALWDKGSGKKADDALIDGASTAWRSATTAEKDRVYEYTYHYCNVNEPLQGRCYTGHQSKSDFLDRVNNITSYIDRSSLPCDAWFQRGDDGVEVIASRIRFAGGTMPNNLQDLVGMEMQEGGFMSAASRKECGFDDKSVIFNIYAPKGTKAAYLEPFSFLGFGAKRNWDGVRRFSEFGDEQETLFQRGTRMRITKVEKANGKIYIDCEVIGQELKPLSYVKDSNIGD